MLKFATVVLIVFAAAHSAKASGFAGCFDHGNDGKEPAGAPRLYRIVQPAGSQYPSLQTVAKAPQSGVFKVIVEDLRFTSYKCWDKEKNLTGHDIELMTQAAQMTGFKFIQFVLKPWADGTVDGKTVPSLLVDLRNGEGDAVSAGMSMTADREHAVTMIGPIYKAGKKLMARKDNPKIGTSRFKAMMNLPDGGYDSLKGLSILVQASTIRADFFRELAAAYPGLVGFLEVRNDSFAAAGDEAAKILVYETDAETIERFTDSHLSQPVFGRVFDLVMIDTGSTQSLIEDGKLGTETRIVSGNLSADPVFGQVFGKGDGVSFRKGSPLIPGFQQALARMVQSGRVDQLVQKWFQDDNAADRTWAD